MRHLTLNFILVLALLTLPSLTSCRSPQVTSEDITVSITVDGGIQSITIPAGSTVTQALQAANITIAGRIK